MGVAHTCAYDCISRAAFLHELKDVAPALVAFMRLFYGQASEYSWSDADGARRGIPQGEGCEQGDPLAPALFALGQHDGLQRASAALREGETLMAFLDDLYVVLPDPARSREAIDLVTGCVEAHTGIAANRGKTRVFTFVGGPAPAGVAELGRDAWRGDKPLEHGFVALGTAEYTQAWATDRLEMEEAFLRQLPHARLAMCLAPPVLLCSTPCQPCAPHDPPNTMRGICRGA